MSNSGGLDIFGRGVSRESLRGPAGQIGPIGPRGPAGIGGLKDMVRWFPQLTLEQFRKYENSCLLLLDPNTDLHVGQGGKYVTWVSQRTNSKNDAKAIFPSGKIRNIGKKKHALIFEKNLYVLKNCQISTRNENSYSCVWITFQVKNTTDQFLLSDKSGSGISEACRGISASNSEIRIWGAKNGNLSYIPISYQSKPDDTWITMYVSWCNMNGNIGEYNINNNEIAGTFICSPVDIFARQDVFIGGLLDVRTKTLVNHFEGMISSIEIYTVGENALEVSLPQELHQLISKENIM